MRHQMEESLGTVRNVCLFRRRVHRDQRHTAPLLLMGAAAVLLAGCGNGAVNKVADAFERSSASEAVTLDTVAPGEWQRIYLFGPYTPPERIAECLEIRSARRLAKNIEHLDNMNLLVVETRTRRFRSRALMRSDVDFSAAAVGAAYAPAAARFAPMRSEWGSVQLGPAEAPSMRCWPHQAGSSDSSE